MSETTAEVFTMTERQRELARHALGLPNKQQTSYRNHFVAGEGHSDFADWMALVNARLAKHWAGRPLTGGEDLFRLTIQGATMALRRGETLDKEDFATRTGRAA